MRRLVPILTALSLTSCGLFEPPKTEEAIAVNAEMLAVFSKHSNAFEKLMLRAEMNQDLKAQVLDFIQQDRDAYRTLHFAMAQYLGAIGELSVDQIKTLVDRAKKLYAQAREATDGTAN